MTARKLPTVLYKIHAYCNNFIAQLFQKTLKTGVPFLHNPSAFPHHPPLQLLQERIPYNRYKNSVLRKRKVFEFTTQIILVLGDDYLNNYWICKHMFFKVSVGNWLMLN